ncbi:LuxR family transcriptional regulator [Pseudomonas sp. R5(2019)]|uniref:helix-turn-helix transcriptional regulator n=1 Tax=Pseudomonas sp. R5(2019) TaxID=2697566 RepID=UPI0014126894|nr:LuxR family transcriptional regulator [Pseudomonas sp. R5(2019)]NBA97333.1 helix-turn-helix transcriptional regulator [Pseudomonas sp. R5(2019)]
MHPPYSPRNKASSTPYSRFAEAPTADPQVCLTAKELTALRWSALGKTSAEIAVICGCTESTINFHFCNIRKKFNVNSRHLAVLKALEKALISLQ